MKKKLLSLSLIIATLFAISSCTKDYLVTVTGSLSGTIDDYTTFSFIAGVKVAVNVNGDTAHYTATTDANGFYTIKNIPLGTYNVILQKTGYATYYSTIYVRSTYINSVTTNSQQSYSVGIALSASLYPLTGQTQGVITYNSIPANGVTVIAYANTSNNTLNYSSTTTTDAHGNYSLTGLPIGPDITIAAYGVSASGSTTESLSLNNKVVPSVESFSISDNGLTLNSYTGEGTSVFVDTTSSIKLYFSENVSQAITASMGGYVTLFKGGSSVAVNVTYLNDTVTLTPVSGYLTNGTTYSVIYYVFATASKSSSNSFNFTTVNQQASITGGTVITIVEINSKYYLQVATSPVVTGSPIIYYLVYEKLPGQNDFTGLNQNPLILTGNGLNITNSPVGTTYYVVPYITVNSINYYGSPSNISPALQ